MTSRGYDPRQSPGLGYKRVVSCKDSFHGTDVLAVSEHGARYTAGPRRRGKPKHSHRGHPGVRHHVALSIVGTDRTPDNGYFRAKVAQEKLIEASGIPYTIIRSTQFLEFLGAIAASSAEGSMVRLSPGLFQPSR